MPVSNETPITVPAQPERNYNLLWMNSLHTIAPTLDSVTLDASFLPYFQDNNDRQFAPNPQPLTFHDQNIFDLHSRRPDLNVIAGAVLDALPTIRQNTPSNILALIELVAQAVGKMAQTPVPSPVETTTTVTPPTTTVPPNETQPNDGQTEPQPTPLPQ